MDATMRLLFQLHDQQQSSSPVEREKERVRACLEHRTRGQHPRESVSVKVSRESERAGDGSSCSVMGMEREGAVVATGMQDPFYLVKT